MFHQYNSLYAVHRVHIILLQCIILLLFTVGPAIGIVIASPLTAVLCEYGFASGWPSVFYVFGMHKLRSYLEFMCSSFNARQGCFHARM